MIKLDLDITKSLKYELETSTDINISDIKDFDDELCDDEILRLEVFMLSKTAILPIYNAEYGYYTLYCDKYFNHGKYGQCRTGLRIVAPKGFRAELVQCELLYKNRLLMAKSPILTDTAGELGITFYQFQNFKPIEHGQVCAKIVLRSILDSELIVKYGDLNDVK